MKWFWGFLVCQSIVFLLGALLFSWVGPLRGLTERLACEPNEHLVSETQVTTGTSSSRETRDCCAPRDDTRAFGKCNWGSSMSLDDAKPMLVSWGLSFVGAIPIAGSLTLLAWWVVRRRARR